MSVQQKSSEQTTASSMEQISQSADKVNLFGRSRAELEEYAESQGWERFHGRQLFRWIYNRRVYSFSNMTDLSKGARQRLERIATVQPLVSSEVAKSSDGTQKFLFQLKPEATIETVLIPYRDTATACISSQAGCALACRFCATGTLELKRNLTAGEIVGQALYLRDLSGPEAFSNIVFMGMGEPLLNYTELIKALEILTAEEGCEISPKRITVSTAGVTPKIDRLAASGLRVNLALSLHAATQEKRLKIMPVAQTFALDKLISAVKNYSLSIKRRITFEYVLLEGFNDTIDDVRKLSKLIQGIDSKVNLLSYNPVPGLEFTRPTDEKLNWFAQELSNRNVLVTVRTSRGRDIDAACGQLAARKMNPTR